MLLSLLVLASSSSASSSLSHWLVDSISLPASTLAAEAPTCRCWPVPDAPRRDSSLQLLTPFALQHKPSHCLSASVACGSLIVPNGMVDRLLLAFRTQKITYILKIWCYLLYVYFRFSIRNGGGYHCAWIKHE